MNKSDRKFQVIKNITLKSSLSEKKLSQIRLVYFSMAFIALLGGIAIYAFFRNINNMFLFRFIAKPLFLNLIYTPIKTETIWSQIIIFNLPYGLWCLSGLLLIRAVWLNYSRWRVIYSGIFMIIVTSYVFLKLPGFIPGTFDVLDIFIMFFFASLESIIFNIFIRRKIV